MDNRNVFVAIALSLAVLLFWSAFFETPKPIRETNLAKEKQTQSKEVLENNISFWLNWKNITLVKRLRLSKKRPVLINLSEKDINKIILQRSKTYSMANHKINCDKFSKNEIIKRIVNIYNEN